MANVKRIVLATAITGALLAVIFIVLKHFKVKNPFKKGGTSGIGSSLTTSKKMEIDLAESTKFNDAYFKTLSSSPTMVSNAKTLLSEMNKEGLISPYTQAGILAVVSKESNFTLKSENLNYTAARLQQVFGLDADTASTLGSLTGDDKQKQIADTVYMPPHNTQLGNVNDGDGYAYRGRGYNQITGRANYKKIGDKIGVDLISNPDMLNDPTVAAKAAIQFFKDGIVALTKNGKMASMYNNPTGDINGFKNELDAAAAMYNVNAGTGQTQAFLLKDVTGGRALTMARAQGFVAWIKSVS